ncbi:MAG TPA: adenylyl-sulfate kinase [Myxococcales bacterium]|jgi:adenylylsulfate kinase|nr:adenylyl-sulfate kinase [Myxococcales bacterium]
MTLGTPSSGFTVWFTGMSGAGKSTLAQGLANRMKRLGKILDVLDGAEVEQMLGVGNAGTKDERNAEVRKLAWICKLVTRGGGIIVQSAVESPYREARDEARRQIGRFAEVFVECPTETLIQRDKSGKYKKALAGELKTLVGITEPYEPPTHPEVVIDTSKYTVDEAVEHVLGQLVAQRLLDPNVAALKSRPKVQARANPSKRVVEPPKAPAGKAGAKPAATKAAAAPVVKLPAPAKAAKPSKGDKSSAQRSAPSTKKPAAARTAHAERPRAAAGGKRKR